MKILVVDEAKELDLLCLLQIQEGNGGDEGREIGDGRGVGEGGLGELAVDVGVDMVEHIVGGQGGTVHHHHGIGVLLLVIVFKAVLGGQDLILLGDSRDHNGLGVTLTETEVFGTLGGGVDVDDTLGTGLSGESSVHGAEFLHIQMGIQMVLNLVREKCVAVRGVSHYALPPS